MENLSSASLTLETPKSAMKSITKESESCDASEKITITCDDEALESKNDRKECPKIRFVEGVDNEQNYHTPISFKMNKFMMCFKSEPDLSRVQSGNDEPILNRGRFIARKLLSGVSMINLRRPFANSSEKASITIEPTEIAEKGSKDIEANDVANVAPETSSIEGTTNIVNDKIDDDDEDFVDDEEVDREYDDSVDKENRSPIQCNTIEFISKLKPRAATSATNVTIVTTAPSTTISCAIALSDSIAIGSVSPITKSTHRMSKAMQVRNN